MKKILIPALMLYGSIALAQIESTKVPNEVKNAAQTKFTEAEVLDWYKVTDGFEANMDEDGESISAVFDKGGKFLYTYTVIPEEELPENITKGINSKYPDAYISDVWYLEVPNGKQYKVTAEMEESNVLLTYDKVGKLLSTATMEEEEE